MAVTSYLIYGVRRGESRTSFLGNQRASNEAEARSRILQAHPGAKITEMKPVEGQSHEEMVAGKAAAISRQRELQDRRYQIRGRSTAAAREYGRRRAGM